MPFRTTDLRTALNRAALFMSVGESQRAVIYRHDADRAYLVLDAELFDELDPRLTGAGYRCAIDLYPDEILQLTGPVQLALLEDDVYAISQKDL